MDHDPSSFKFWGGYLCSSRKGGHRRPKTSRTTKNQRSRAKGKGEKQVFPVFPALLYPTSLVFRRLFPKGRHESAAFVRMHPPGALRFGTHERKKRIGICRPICIRLHTLIKIKASTKKRYDNSLIIKRKACLFRKKIVSLYCNWERWWLSKLPLSARGCQRCSTSNFRDMKISIKISFGKWTFTFTYKG